MLVSTARKVVFDECALYEWSDKKSFNITHCLVVVDVNHVVM